MSVQDDITTLVEDFEHVTLQCTGMEKELDELHEQIGSLVLSEKASRPNSGKPIDELSPRQARRKMSEFRDHVEAVLWFAESYGLNPTILQLKTTTSRQPVELSLYDEDPATPTSPSSSVLQDEKEKLLQVGLLIR